jgi:PhnB protein
MQFIPYLGFNGNCRDALEFYAKTLGARLELMEFEGTPAAEHVPASARNQIMHAVRRLEAGR